MLTLFTGVPGSGKTAALVALMSKVHAGRPLYVHALNGLTIPHTKLDANDWHNVVPDGSIVIIDEVQAVWRPSGPGQKVPLDIQALETHRHRGIDFYLTTQGPKLVHANVRDLIGRHIHIRDLGMLGRWWYEWPECSTSVAWRSAPIKKKYRLPKEAFALYKSASIHVKPIRSVPWMALLLLLLIVAVIGGSYYAMNRVSSKINPTAAIGPTVASSAPQSTRPTLPLPLTAKAMREALQPRMANVPNSAPIYDELRKPVHMPRIVGGYCQAARCHCFIQGGMRAPMTEGACFAWLKEPPFDPYFQPGQNAREQPSSSTSQADKGQT